MNEIIPMYYFFHRWDLWCYADKNHCQNKSYFFYVSLYEFYSFASTDKSLIIFKLFCMMVMWSLYRLLWFLFFADACSVVTAPFTEKNFFAPLNCLYSFVKDQLTIFMWVYLWSTLFSLIHLFVYSFTNTKWHLITVAL